MHIESLSLHGFKGLRGEVKFTSNRVIAIGPVGAGKTSLLQALRILCGLPTALGESNLGRFGIAGGWSAEVSIDGKRFGRSFAPRGDSRMVQGVQTAVANYQALLGSTGLGAVPDVDLGDFLALSGQKRAEMFSGLVGSDSFTLEAAVKQATGVDFSTFAGTVVGNDAEHIRLDYVDCNALVTPSDLCDHVRDMVNQQARGAKEATAVYQNLCASPAVSGEDPAAVQTELGTENQKLGAAQSRKGEANAERDRAQAARNLLQSTDQSISAAEKSIERLRVSAGERRTEAERLEGQIGKLSEGIEPLHKRIEELQNQKGAVIERCEKATHAYSVAQSNSSRARGASGLRSVSDLTPIPVEAVFAMTRHLSVTVPADFDAEQMGKDLVKIIVHPWLEAQAAFMTKAAEEAKAAVETAEAEMNAANVARAEYANELRQAQRQLEQLEDRIRTTRNEAATAASGSARNLEDAAEAERQLEIQRRRRNEMAASTQQTAVTTDIEALDAEIEGLTESIGKIRTRLSAAEKGRQAAGQRERARLEMLIAEAKVKVFKALLERLQAWRDRIMGERMTKVMTPFQKRMNLVFGKESGVALRSVGVGRATVFDFDVIPHNIPVPLENLSAGETALAAAAFLAAMHEFTGSKAKILTMDAEALDRPSLHRLMTAIPSLGFDFAMLTSNRTMPEDVPEGWQVVNCPIGECS